MPNGRFHLGDNLPLLRSLPDASVDLVHADPPFCSGKDYGAFDDRWRWDDNAAIAVHELPLRLRHVMMALLEAVGPDSLLAYLTFMAPRLAELHRVMRPTATLYLHVDPTASSYLRVLLDAIFGPACFRNEVIWRYRRWPTKASRFQRMHDVLLVYRRSTSHEPTFHTLYGYERLAESTLKTFGTKRQRAHFDDDGHRTPGTEDAETPGPPLSDVWEIGIVPPSGKERTGYPTQKPEPLLERVVLASSNPGDTVLDPFCGSGTTLAVAHRLNREWIGIDASPVAIEAARARLGKAFAFDSCAV